MNIGGYDLYDDVILDDNGKVHHVVDDGRALYPYRLRMIHDGFGGWRSDGWDNCSGWYKPAYLARLMREDKAKWA